MIRRPGEDGLQRREWPDCRLERIAKQEEREYIGKQINRSRRECVYDRTVCKNGDFAGG